MSKSTNSTTLGFGSVLGLIFITLKLCGVITWSWWWVLSPFWLPLVFLLGLLTLAGLVGFLAHCWRTK